MARKRVVVTGLSAITPIGNSVAETWENLLAGKSGIGPITLFDATEFDARIAGELKNFDPESFGISAKLTKRMDRFVLIGAAAGNALVKDCGMVINDDNAEDIGVILGVGLGGLSTIESFHTKLMETGPKRVSPFVIPMLISNMAPGQISILNNCKGPNLVVTSACASGLHALGYAFTDILLDRCVAVISGGVESTITPMGVSGFCALKALSTDNENPTKASRPFDKDRTGFVMGEGAGLLMLESLEAAKARGATIYAEMTGFGSSADAFHMTAPESEGTGMALAMNRAIKDAGLTPDDIDHINAHGTSTYLNDLCETKAIKKVFGKRAYNIPITANKSQVGHLLGAAGGLESVISVLTLYHGIIPATANYTNKDPDCDLDYVADGPRKQQVENVLCNSFGFGGTNCCLVFKRWKE